LCFILIYFFIVFLFLLFISLLFILIIWKTMSEEKGLKVASTAHAGGPWRLGEPQTNLRQSTAATNALPNICALQQ
jgi:hypothetical protein